MLIPAAATVYVATLLKPGILRAIILLVTYFVAFWIAFGISGGWPAIYGAVFGTPVAVVLTIVWIYINDRRSLKKAAEIDITSKKL